MDPTVLDTDVASLLHRGTLAGPLATRLIGREPLITFVTFGELAKWAEIRNWGQHRRQELTSWLSRIAVLPGDEAVAATWGRPARGSRPARATAAGQRHVGRGLLPHPWHPASNLESKGLRGLQSAPRLAHPRPGVGGAGASGGSRHRR